MSSIVSPPSPHEQLCNRYCSNKHTQPRPGWAPDPLMVGIRSPRWAGGWVLHQSPWSFGFYSQTRGTRENRAPPCVKVPLTHRTKPWLHADNRMEGRQMSCCQQTAPPQLNCSKDVTAHLHWPVAVLAAHAPSQPAAGSHCHAREDSAPVS